MGSSPIAVIMKQLRKAGPTTLKEETFTKQSFTIF